MKRLESIDFMRGLVIVIMALDHVRDLMHTTSMTQDPMNLSTTTPILFMTRWITYLCAPIFVFLAGTSAYLMLKSQNNLSETKRFLLTRGLWLIFLELTIVSFGIWFDVLFRTILLQVIFAIGFSFIILSFLLKLKSRTIGIIGLVIILTHNLVTLLQLNGTTGLGAVISAFFTPNIIPVGSVTLASMYPIIPWLGIMLFGFGFGEIFELPSQERKMLLFKSSAIAFIVFIGLRTFNIYGDAALWSPQKSILYSFLSIINVTKYPPSLLYDAITLGVMFLVLGLSEGKSTAFTRFFLTYGRVPLFFYILHWYVIHSSMLVMVLLQGTAWKDVQFGPFSFGRPASGVGLELPFVYLFWISIILLFYPLCRWYGRYKAENRDKKWLSYL